MISAGYAKTYDRAEATTLYTRAITMEDMPITRGEGHVPLATLKVQGTYTDASPSEPPRYARSDDMLMPDRLLRFDKQYRLAAQVGEVGAGRHGGRSLEKWKSEKM